MASAISGLNPKRFFLVWLNKGQSLCATFLRGLQKLRMRVEEATVKVRPGMLTRVWQQLDYHIDSCHIHMALTSSHYNETKPGHLVRRMSYRTLSMVR
ncbi:hypothetical protein ANN_20870 [Periplaneta americana]|uniref:Uncharacterized protein n=1 Tax=Periplaneta americana TaxID=6978 RepID=A0ABQ8SDU2_PERAM|nr:hypothetical protein ANN_20870 [Periplaneta americana]